MPSGQIEPIQSIKTIKSIIAIHSMTPIWTLTSKIVPFLTIYSNHGLFLPQKFWLNFLYVCNIHNAVLNLKKPALFCPERGGGCWNDNTLLKRHASNSDVWFWKICKVYAAALQALLEKIKWTKAKLYILNF